MHRWLVLFMAVSMGVLIQYESALCSETEGALRHHFPVGTPFILRSAAEAVGNHLNALDRDLAEASGRLANLDLKREAARRVIRRLHARHSDCVIDACTISPGGVMLLVEPARYSSFEGKDISGQEQIKTLMRTRRPVMSRVFRTVEGIEAVDLEYPVFGPEGKYRGSMSVIFQPWVLIGKSVHDLVAGMPMEVWAMQPDGSIIYDVDPHEVGRNLFTDKTYQPFPELVQLGRRIAAVPEGHGSYSYFKAETSEVVRKNAWWVSLELHGMAWRLVSIHPTEPAGHALSDGAKPFSRQAFRSLAHEPALIFALERGERENAVNRLRQAVDTHTGIYSLSWVDARAVNRFGYPRHNSLFNVDLKTQTDAASKVIVRAIRQRRELEYVGPLVEGGRARYCLTPVLDGRKYLGSLLWIQKED